MPEESGNCPRDRSGWDSSVSATAPRPSSRGSPTTATPRRTSRRRAAKVGRDVAEAIAAPPNNTDRFAAVPPTGVVVARGPTLDGLGRYLREDVEESDRPVADVARILERTRTDIVVSYLPVGAQQATEWYAERALDA